MQNLLKILLLSAAVSFTGCSTMSGKQLAGGLVGGAANTNVGYSAHQCYVVKNRCVDGHYEEWQTRDGEAGCSCKQNSN